MKNITVIIFTYNEEKNIKECIESALLLTPHIIVIDTESTDATAKIAKQMGAGVFSFPNYSYVEPARQYGIERIETDWFLILDADERMTEELALEIKTTIPLTTHSYFKIPRKNIFGHTQWLRSGGWWPDQQIRVIKKTKFKSWPSQIHSTPIIEGTMGFFSSPLLHYFHGNMASMVEKTIVFEDIESKLLHEAQKTVKTTTFFRKFMGELVRRLVFKKGFIDGYIGIIESIYQAFSKTITYIYLYEKKKNKSL